MIPVWGTNMDAVQCTWGSISRGFFSAQHAQAGQSVGDAAFQDARQTGRFFVIHRRDDFAANIVAHFVPVAKMEQLLVAFLAVERFVAAGLVIYAGVNDAAVAPGLMPGRALFFVNDTKPQVGPAFFQLVSSGRSHNSSPDDNDIVQQASLNLTRRSYIVRLNKKKEKRWVILSAVCGKPSKIARLLH
jgi:hypothetical protein